MFELCDRFGNELNKEQVLLLAVSLDEVVERRRHIIYKFTTSRSHPHEEYIHGPATCLLAREEGRGVCSISCWRARAHTGGKSVVGRRLLVVLDDEPRGERPAGAGAAAAAARHPAGAGAGPAARVAVGPAVAHAVDAAGATARGAARARVPPGRGGEAVPEGPVGHGHAGEHAQPRRRDHHRSHHRRSIGLSVVGLQQQEAAVRPAQECLDWWMIVVDLSGEGWKKKRAYTDELGRQCVWRRFLGRAARVCRRRWLRRRRGAGMRVVL